MTWKQDKIYSNLESNGSYTRPKVDPMAAYISGKNGRSYGQYTHQNMWHDMGKAHAYKPLPSNPNITISGSSGPGNLTAAVVGILILFIVVLGIVSSASDNRRSNIRPVVSASNISLPVPTDLGKYTFMMPFTHRVAIDRIDPQGEAAAGPLRFWQCVSAVNTDSSVANLRLVGGDTLQVSAADLEPIGHSRCITGPLIGPTEMGFKVLDQSLRYLSARPVCAFSSGDGHMWSCSNRDQVRNDAKVLD